MSDKNPSDLMESDALRFFRSKPFGMAPGPGYMLVCSLNPSGSITRRWSKIKEPDRFPSHGSAHLEPYVERLLNSKATFPTLGFFAHDDHRGSGIWRMDGGCFLSLTFNTKDDVDREARARTFFEARHFPLVNDHVDLPGTIRMLLWQITGTAAEITRLCQTVLVELCEVDESEGLLITFEEREIKTDEG